MKLLKIRKASGDVQEIVLRGDRRDPEPVHLRVRFPGGEAELVRTTDDDYWLHLYINTPEREGWDPAAVMGRVTDARIDLTDGHVNDSALGDLGNPKLYHFAIRVGKKPREGS